MKHVFNPKIFNIPNLKGISVNTIEEHIKLYQGYVSNANTILAKTDEYKKDPSHAYALSEITRRFGFEYNGIRNHELYFSSLEGGSSAPNQNSKLHQDIIRTWGDFDVWINEFKTIALTRGIGWAILYYDTKDKILLNTWIDEQHIGQLQGCIPVIALDMWEHSFVTDYKPTGKKQYVEDFFANINWNFLGNRYESEVL